MTLATVGLVSAGAGVGLVVAAWLGLQVRPRRLAPPGPSRESGTAELPGDLPVPVRRFYAAIGMAGPSVARVDTFTLWGRARMKRHPLPRMPVTFWSEHRVGWSGLQLLAVTWYGIPILRGRDHYIDGRGEMVIGGRRASGPEIDQGENLFLWAELVLVPSALATRPGVHWQPIDETSARLIIPLGESQDEMVFHFDPATGLLDEAIAMRYREVGAPKVGWHIGYRAWRRFDAGLFPARITVTWADHSRPWFVLDVDDVAINAPVSDLFAAGSPAPS